MVTLGYMRICMHAKSLQSCLTLYDPMDCTPPGSSVHEILQARILEWVAVPSSRRAPNPGVEPLCLCLLHWQTYSSWSHLGNPHVSNDTSGEGNGNPLQYSWLENPMDRGEWTDIPWGRQELDTTKRLHFLFHFLLLSEAWPDQRHNSASSQGSCL